MTSGSVILTLLPDLFFLSRVRAAAEHHLARVETARRADRLAPRAAELLPALIIIDMGGSEGWATAVRDLKANPSTANIPVIVFGPHVEQENQALARTAGADRVLSNSRFTETLPDLLARYLSPGAT